MRRRALFAGVGATIAAAALAPLMPRYATGGMIYRPMKYVGIIPASCELVADYPAFAWPAGTTIEMMVRDAMAVSLARDLDTQILGVLPRNAPLRFRL